VVCVGWGRCMRVCVRVCGWGGEGRGDGDTLFQPRTSVQHLPADRVPVGKIRARQRGHKTITAQWGRASGGAVSQIHPTRIAKRGTALDDHAVRVTA
jgi:hypothetical protein